MKKRFFYTSNREISPYRVKARFHRRSQDRTILHRGGTMKRDFSELAEKWQSPIVARKEVGRFSGGLLHPRTMANVDSDPEIEGPERIVMGRGVAYFTDSLVDYMNRRAGIEV